MWSPAAVTTVGVAIGLTGAAATYALPRPRDDEESDAALIRSLENIRTADHAIRLLQRLCQKAPTEDVASRVSDIVKAHGVSETCVQCLSRLHRRHGADLGPRGYAITLVWTSTLQAIAEDAVIVVD